MGQTYVTPQIFPGLIAAPMCYRCPHPHKHPRPGPRVLKEVCIKVTKSGNSAHNHTPQPEIQTLNPKDKRLYQYIPLPIL